MLGAIVATFTAKGFNGQYLPFIIAVVCAVAVGISIAQSVQMVNLPQLVALFHSFVGMSAMLVCFSTFHSPAFFQGHEHIAHRVETFVAIFIAGVTFSGSVIAAAKLDDSVSAVISFNWKIPARHLLNIVLI
eukprot:Selendium_serpulae@DN8053_c0_g1_i1.p1